MPDMFIAVIIGVSMLLVIAFISAIKQEKKSAIDKKIIDDSYKYYSRGAGSENISTVQRNLEQLRLTQQLYSSEASIKAQRYLEEDIQDLSSDLSVLLQEKWETKARKYTDKFKSTFVNFIDSDFPDLASATRAKTSCLNSFDAFNDMTLAFLKENARNISENDIWKEFKEDISIAIWANVDCSFRISKASSVPYIRQQIDSFLSDRIDSMRPEYKRKAAIYKELLSIVEKEAPLYRSQLLKMVENYDSKEVAAAYRYLVKKDKFYEYKVSNRFLVELSDKEKSRRSNPA